MGKRRMPQMGGNMGNMLKQAQQMQKNMLKKQQEVEAMEFSASAGGGAIEVVVSGKKEVISVSLKEEIVDADDIEMLQDLIIASVNEALKKANEAMEEAMGAMTGGMGLPGMF